MKHVLPIEQHQLDLSFVRRNDCTVLGRRLFSYPYVIMKTFGDPAGSSSEQAGARSMSVIVQNSSGPIHDRDDLATRLQLDVGTSARIAYQGATAVHRARSGNMSRERLLVCMSPESRLTYLPAPRIYFPEAAHKQSTDIELSKGSSLFYADSFIVHDPSAIGQAPREIDSTLIVRRDAEILLLDRQHLRTPRFDGVFRAFGTILLLGLEAPPLPNFQGLYTAASRLPSNLGWCIRLAALDLRPLRSVIDALTRTSH